MFKDENMHPLSFPSALAPWLLLHRLPGFSNRCFSLLEQRAIDPQSVLQALPPPRLSALLPAPVVERITALRGGGDSDPLWQQMLRDLDTCERLGIRVIHRAEPVYPALLRHTGSAPPLLFVRGNTAVLGDTQLAIVGARNATAGGLKLAAAFARQLCEQGLTITSGLALGIDAAAHQGALAAGTTIAVLGTGIDVIYPRSHVALAQQILERGAIVSELAPGSPARREHFPRRNRLISGLSRGVLVVEAAVQSGSLITAHFAAEQGREVFAVPGSIHNPLARGCHALIRNGATLVESIDDILAELGAPPRLPLTQATLALTDDESAAPQALVDPAALALLSGPAQAVFAALGEQAVTPDRLLECCALPPSQLAAALLELELAGLAQACAGGYLRHSQYLPTR